MFQAPRNDRSHGRSLRAVSHPRRLRDPFGPWCHICLSKSSPDSDSLQEHHLYQQRGVRRLWGRKLAASIVVPAHSNSCHQQDADRNAGALVRTLRDGLRRLDLPSRIKLASDLHNCGNMGPALILNAALLADLYSVREIDRFWQTAGFIVSEATTLRWADAFVDDILRLRGTASQPYLLQKLAGFYMTRGKVEIANDCYAQAQSIVGSHGTEVDGASLAITKAGLFLRASDDREMRSFIGIDPYRTSTILVSGAIIHTLSGATTCGRDRISEFLDWTLVPDHYRVHAWYVELSRLTPRTAKDWEAAYELVVKIQYTSAMLQTEAPEYRHRLLMQGRWMDHHDIEDLAVSQEFARLGPERLRELRHSALEYRRYGGLYDRLVQRHSMAIPVATVQLGKGNPEAERV